MNKRPTYQTHDRIRVIQQWLNYVNAFHPHNILYYFYLYLSNCYFSFIYELTFGYALARIRNIMRYLLFLLKYEP